MSLYDITRLRTAWLFANAISLNIDSDASRNTCYRRSYTVGLCTCSILPGAQAILRANWESEYLRVYGESKYRRLVCTACGIRGVRLLSCRVCRAVGPASSRLRVISTTLSRCSDFRRSKGSDLNHYINYWKKMSDKPQQYNFIICEGCNVQRKIYVTIHKFYKPCIFSK